MPSGRSLYAGESTGFKEKEQPGNTQRYKPIPAMSSSSLMNIADKIGINVNSDDKFDDHITDVIVELDRNRDRDFRTQCQHGTGPKNTREGELPPIPDVSNENLGRDAGSSVISVDIMVDSSNDRLDSHTSKESIHRGKDVRYECQHNTFPDSRKDSIILKAPSNSSKE
jgi:hypothetical protein